MHAEGKVGERRPFTGLSVQGTQQFPTVQQIRFQKNSHAAVPCTHHLAIRPTVFWRHYSYFLFSGHVALRLTLGDIPGTPPKRHPALLPPGTCRNIYHLARRVFRISTDSAILSIFLL